MIELTKDEKENLQSGISSPFWQTLKKCLGERADYLRQQILENDDLIERIEITNRDLLRKEYKLTKYLLELPENLIKGEKEYTPKVSDDDPYFKAGENSG